MENQATANAMHQTVFVLPTQKLDQLSICDRICYCGRIAWRKELQERDSIDFVNIIKRKNHTSVLEHGYIYLSIPNEKRMTSLLATFGKFFSVFVKPYPQVRTEKTESEQTILIAGNVRAWLEWWPQVQNSDLVRAAKSVLLSNYPDIFACFAQIGVIFRYDISVVKDIENIPPICRPFTAEITTDRGTTHQLVRHRILSFTQESTRFVSYKDGVPYIEEITTDNEYRERRKEFIKISAEYYKDALQRGERKETARDFLPHFLASKIVITGLIPHWYSFIQTRKEGDSQSRIREIALFLDSYIKEYLANTPKDWS